MQSCISFKLPFPPQILFLRLYEFFLRAIAMFIGEVTQLEASSQQCMLEVLQPDNSTVQWNLFGSCFTGIVIGDAGRCTVTIGHFCDSLSSVPPVVSRRCRSNTPLSMFTPPRTQDSSRILLSQQPRYCYIYPSQYRRTKHNSAHSAKRNSINMGKTTLFTVRDDQSTNTPTLHSTHL